MANTGSKIYRTLRLFINGVRSEHVKPNYATDPNYIPPFTDLNSCYTDAPAPVPIPIPTPAPAPQPAPAPIVAPIAAPSALPPSPAPSPVAAPGIIPVPAPIVSKPPVVPTPVGGGLLAYLSGPMLSSFGLCTANFSMTTKVEINAVRIPESLDKVVSRNGVVFDGQARWYAAAAVPNLTTQSSDFWWALLIDGEGKVREIALGSTLCRDGDILFSTQGDDDVPPKRKGDSGVLDDVRGPGLL